MPNSPTFKSELVRCRDMVAREPFAPRRSIELKTLERWLDRHDDAQKHWATIEQAASATLSAYEFIEQVLERAYLANRAVEINAESPRVEKQAISLAQGDFADGRYSMAIVRQELAGKNRALRKRALGHKPKFGARRDFMNFFSQTFLSTCGKHLDIVVAFLAQVALDDAKVDATDVRDARRIDIRKQK
jgi:hypothetical protein